MSITLTLIAAKQIKLIIEENKLDESNSYLRLAVRGGGCSGFEYVLDLTEEVSEDDWKFESEGIKIVCDQKSYLYLSGTDIDFKEELMGRGFVFNNPNSSGSCGCGSSFSV